MKIITWNINGIRAALGKNLKPWMLEQAPDVFCLQEIKATPQQLTDEQRVFPGYSVVWNPAQRPGYSGVATFSKQEPGEVQLGLDEERFDVEGRVIRTRHDDFFLYNIYFPNGKQSEERLRYKMEFYDAFLEFIEKQKENGKNLVICGDVNTAHHEIDLARPKENETISGFLPEERAWMDKFVSAGYVDTFRMFHPEPDQYTWWAPWGKARERNIGWRIDYFYVNQEIQTYLKDAFILPEIMGSDHCPIGLELEIPA